MTSGQGVLTIYGPLGTKHLVDNIMSSMGPAKDIGLGFSNSQPLSNQIIKVVELRGDESLSLGELVVHVVENTHFSFDRNGPIPSKSFSYRFDLHERSIVYSGDTGPSAALVQLALGADLLVSEMIDLTGTLRALKRNNPKIPPTVLDTLIQHLRDHHLTTEQIGKMARDAKVKHVVLTHLVAGNNMNNKIEIYVAEVKKFFAGKIDIANDLDKF